MTKRKTGLHRKVSSIFNGVSVPKSNPGNSSESAGGRTDAPKEGEPSQRQSDFMPKDVPASPKRPPRGFGKGLSPSGGLGPSRLTEFGPLGPISAISNKRRKTTMVLMVALFVILILVLTSTFSRRLAKKKATSALKEATAAAKAAASSSDTKIDWDIPPEYPDTLRDPMETTWSKDPPNRIEARSNVVRIPAFIGNDPRVVLKLITAPAELDKIAGPASLVDEEAVCDGMPAIAAC